MIQIHLVIPFSRLHLKNDLIYGYRDMGAILHPIMFVDEEIDFSEPLMNGTTARYIYPEVIQEYSHYCHVKMPGCYKRNWFIRNRPINDEDYYVTADDDDFYEPGVFDKIKTMTEDIIIISMKRGHHIPEAGKEWFQKHGTSTLLAVPEHTIHGLISAQQSFVKGRIFKEHLFNEEYYCWDGEMAEHHKNSGEQIRYAPDLYALFNYFEPGRWDK